MSGYRVVTTRKAGPGERPVVTAVFPPRNEPPFATRSAASARLAEMAASVLVGAGGVELPAGSSRIVADDQTQYMVGRPWAGAR